MTSNRPVTVGLSLGGPSLTPAEDLSPGTGLLGHAVLGPAGLLRDLELRLGLLAPEPSRALRLARWSSRISELLAAGNTPFFADSFRLDPVGTADELLRWRDLLVESGWGGQSVEAPRIADLRSVEENRGMPVPPGPCDRLVAVERTLTDQAALASPYSTLELVEPRTLWPTLWQRIFTILEGRGCEVRALPPISFTIPAPTAAPGDDLARLKLRLSDRSEPPAAFEGDGSIIALRAETPAELASGVAALLRKWGGTSTVVVRGADRAILDGALAEQGLSPQGNTPHSRHRPALQILPLALELAFEPKDPRRLMELLTLPVGPFRGMSGRMLSRALSEAPGVGGPEWIRARDGMANRVGQAATKRSLEEGADEARARADGEARRDRMLERVKTWIESPGAPAAGAPRERIVEVATMVKAWAAAIRAVSDEDDGLTGTIASCQQFLDAGSNDPAETLSLLRVRHILDDILSLGHPFAVSRELAGRIDHVDHPGSLLVPRDTVVWWGFDDSSVEAITPPPFTPDEVAALERTGVSFVPTREIALDAARRWQKVVLAAGKRVVLAWPRSRGGEEVVPHPLWDEIVARSTTKDGTPTAARITLDVSEIAEGGEIPLLRGDARPETRPVSPLSLPEARGVWRVPANAVTVDRLSVTRLEDLIGCPLRWVLEGPAGVRERRTAEIRVGPLLYGKLAHRLVEELFAENALREDPVLFAARAEGRLVELIRTEGATLLAEGASKERREIQETIVAAARALNSLLAASGLEPEAVEDAFETPWPVGDSGREPITLRGKIDLRCRDVDGRGAILDLKWGRKAKETLLAEGNAVQLAAYAWARPAMPPNGAPPRTAYFSIREGLAMTTEDGWLDGDRRRVVAGPSAAETWARVETSFEAIRSGLDQGRVPVFGLQAAERPAAVAGLPPERAADILDLGRDTPCTYCSFDSLCGRRWKGLAG